MFNRNTPQPEEKRMTTKRPDRVNGLLDKGCSFEGKLTFDGTVQINGDFSGEIYSDGILEIGTDATVNAKVFVDTAIINGKFEGEIEAKNKIELHVPAVVTANIKTKTLSIEDGVQFHGTCQMDRKEIKLTDRRTLVESDMDEDSDDQPGEDVLVM